MDMTIDQQVALNEALVLHASRLRIGKSNFRLRSDIASKESTLQLVYDVLRLTPFYKAFLVTADVPEIYILPNQTFDELPFEEEILAFLRYLGHSGEIKKLTDVNINKLHQPWRSFSTVINKCLSWKSTCYDSLRFCISSLAQDAKKSNEMYYPRFTKVIIHFFMTKDPSILRRNKPQKEACNKLISPKLVDLVQMKEQDDDDQDDDDQDDNDDDDDQDTDNNSDDFVHPKLSIHEEEAKDEESFDPIFARAVSSIPGIVERYMDQRMNEAVKVAVQIQSDRLRDKAQAKNEEFLNKLDENIQKIIKEQVKEQVKTSYDVVAGLFEIELKKILIEKMESNKSIHRSDKQRNLYKALADAYECDKIILDTYGDTVTLKRRRDDADKDEDPSAGSDRGSKIRRKGKEPESTSAPKEKATKTTGKSTKGSKSHQKTASGSAPAEEPMQTTQDLEEPLHQEFETGAADDQPIVEALCILNGFRYTRNLQLLIVLGTTLYQLMDTPVDFSAFLMNRLKVDTLTPELLVGISHWGRKRQHFYGFSFNGESARDVYSKRRIIAVTELQIVEWHNYKHLDWITMRRDDDKLYMFKEGNFKRLRIQDIKDMLLLLAQGKLTNLTVKERFTFNVSLRMFTRSIVIQRCVEDLQLGVESYQTKLNLTKPDTYYSGLKHKEAYTAYFNPIGFIYQNKDKQNKLMRIDELHKFSNGTLNDVRTALGDHLKGIQMKYLPQAIWRRSDKERPESKGYTYGYPLVSVEVLMYDKRSRSENMRIVPTGMELILEQAQQGISHEVSVGCDFSLSWGARDRDSDRGQWVLGKIYSTRREKWFIARKVYMLSPTDSTCSGVGGTVVGGGDGDIDDDSDGEGDLDLLRDKVGNSDGGGEGDDVKSDGGDDNDGISDGSSG
uniref:Uncharacterized protein n=1 Tax=Tanacetum cinerariifolium TaxID=118510 RepID=A0A6L2NDL4_TANCI|nr:hypothetical protein [Tanacetum cinerariifolium]